MGHTKGPWKSHENEPIVFVAKAMDESAPYGTFFCSRVLDHEGGIMAVVPFHGVDDEEDTANLRLVTAAPDLLAALKEAVRLGVIPLEEGLPRTTQTEIGTMARMVRAAIRKAEGKQT